MDHPGAMDALLGRLHDALATAGQVGPEPVTGASEDGLVSATVGTNGRVTAIEGDPRVLRRPAGEVAAAIAEAVNDALDALAASAAGGPDLMTKLREVQEDSARVMAQTTGEYVAAVKRMEDLH